MSFDIALIGCGDLATGFHGPAIARYASMHPDTRLAACCDVDAERARAFAERFGFARWETDLDRVLADHRPHAVCLFVPVHLTCELACRVLRRGFPLLVEKPPGQTTGEIDRMIRAADAAGTHVDVAFNRRHMPLVARLMRAVADAGVSPVALQHVQYEMVRWNRRDPDFSSTAVHGIDLVRFVAGSAYRSVECRYQPQPQLGPTVANIHLDCAFASGATARASFLPAAGAVAERVSLHARDHSFYVELPIWDSMDAPGRFRHVHRRQPVVDVTGPEVLAGDSEGDARRAELFGFYDEDAAFFDHVRHGRPARVGLRDARQSVAVMQALRERLADVPDLRE